MAEKIKTNNLAPKVHPRKLELDLGSYQAKVQNSLINIEKKGILLVNLGSPESSNLKDVKKYLNQFLMDGNVIDIPYLFRLFLVRGVIVPNRANNSAKLYQKIWTNEGSPLIVNSKKLEKKVKTKASIPTALAMRYGSPSIKMGLLDLVKKDITEVLVIPLYPQHAMSSTQTVIEEIEKIKDASFPKLTLSYLPAFYKNNEYIKVLAKSINNKFDRSDHLLFSYHGLPDRHLKKTDPTGSHCLQTEDCCTTPNVAHKTCYKHQCIKTTALVASELGLEKNSYSISYQSRLGNDPWILPSTTETIKKMPANGIKKLAIVTPAFVSDCLETIEEIGMEAKKDFLENGGEKFTRIECLNDNDEWAELIASWVKKGELFEKTN